MHAEYVNFKYCKVETIFLLIILKCQEVRDVGVGNTAFLNTTALKW